MTAMADAGHRGYEDDDQIGEMSFSSVAGTIRLVDKSRFERQLYRSTRGNCLCGLAA